MKKKYKNKIKKSVFIIILIIFTAVSIIPGAAIFKGKNSNNSITVNKDNVEELFGEGAVYDSVTGEVHYPDNQTKEKTE